MKDPKRYSRALPLRRQSAEGSSSLPKAISLSAGVHLLFVAGVALISELEWRAPAGAPSAPREIQVASARRSEVLMVVREPELVTEVPEVVEEVDLVEDATVFEEPEPNQPAERDPLLDEDPFEELELEAFETLAPEEAVEEEPVGEELEELRELLESPAAVYPERAALRRLEGTVLLRMTVGPDGDVLDVELIQSSGHGSLDRAAIQAARGYRFEPGEGTITVSKPFTFRLR